MITDGLGVLEQVRVFRVGREPLSAQIPTQGQGPQSGIMGSRLGEVLHLRTLWKGQRQRQGCAGPWSMCLGKCECM